MLSLLKQILYITNIAIAFQLIIAFSNSSLNLASFVLILFHVVVINFFLSRLVSFKDIKGIKPTKIYLLVYFTFLVFSLLEIKNWELRGSLSQVQELPRLGLIVKMVTTILPALLLLWIRTRNFTFYSMFLLYSIVVIVAASHVWSKSLILPVALITIILFKKKKSLLLLGGFMILLVFSFIYMNRGEELSNVPRLILYRFPGINEFQVILSYIQENLIFDWWNSEGNSVSRITENVFGYTTFKIGIAPGFYGFFVLYFSIFSIPVCVSFLYLLNHISKILRSRGNLGILIINLWTFELLSFMMDGVPHFIYSTTNAILFKFLLLITAIIYIYASWKNYLSSQLEGHT